MSLWKRRFHVIATSTSVVIMAGCTSDSSDSADDSADPSTAPLLDEYLLDGDDSFPESAAWDPEERAFYTSSLGRGDVTKVAVTGETSTFFAGDDSNDWVTVGLEIDVSRRQLWVCASVFDGSAPGQLWVLDLDSGERVATHDLGAAKAEASCTDVNIAPDGKAYVTDRANPNIYLVDPAAGTVQTWLEHAMLEPDLIGLNGVAFSPNGEYLLVTKYLEAELLRIPLADSTEISAVQLDGDAFAGAGALGGADDLLFVDNVLYVTVVDGLLRLTTNDAEWASATVAATVLEQGGVTGLVLAEGQVYGANGQAVEYSLGLSPDTPFWLRRLVAG